MSTATQFGVITRTLHGVQHGHGKAFAVEPPAPRTGGPSPGACGGDTCARPHRCRRDRWRKALALEAANEAGKREQELMAKNRDGKLVPVTTEGELGATVA